MNRQGICLAGYGETKYIRPKGGDTKSVLSYMAEAIKLALDNSGLQKKDIDGLAVVSMTDLNESPVFAEYLGLELNWIMKGDFGGASGIMTVRRAADNIQLGESDVIVCVGADIWPREFPELISSTRTNYQEPLGWGGPNARFGMIEERYLSEYGITLEHLGKIATSLRKNAQLTEDALLHSLMEVDDYVNSRLIADPVRFSDCCMICSGACAVVVTSEQKAKEHTAHPVYLVSDVEKTNYQVSKQLPDITRTAFDVIAEELFSEVGRDEIDFVEIYDDYPVAILMQLEGLGFFSKSEVRQFVESHNFRVDGDFPINTGGGQLSRGQPGLAGGYLHIAEAVRQLKEEAGNCQVEGAKTGLVTGIGTFGYTYNLCTWGAMILQRR